MKRLFWFGAGIAVGVLAVRLVRRQVERFSPGGIADTAVNQMGGLLGSVRDFIADVREGMAERESELREPWERGDWPGHDLDGWDDDEHSPGPDRR